MATAGMPYGLQAMLKEGHKHMAGVDEAVIKNIEAARGLSEIARTSMGPNGMNKMVINHLEKLFVTCDASTIVNELEVQHPAARILVLAAKAQEQEIGDGTNAVVSLAGQMLSVAEVLLRDGLHPSEIAAGYEKAGEKALEYLKESVIPGTESLDMSNAQVVASKIKGTISSKQYGYEDKLSKLVAEACINVCPKNPMNFNVDNVRVCKIVGSSLLDSHNIQGIVIQRNTEGSIKNVENAKVAVYGMGVDTSGTETKGTVVIHSAEELQNYSKSEEQELESRIKAIAETGCKIIVSGASIGEMAMHFIERYKMMAIKLTSKFELRRLCRATGATNMLKLEAPSPDQLGFAASMKAIEIGGTKVIVLKQDAAMGNVATVILRGATDQVMNDVERAIDDGVNAYKSLCRDSRVLPAGGATEIEVARKLRAFAKSQTGLEQYAINKFAEALEIIPRTLAENAGVSASNVVSSLYAAHAEGKTNNGVDVDGDTSKDLCEDDVFDLFNTKWWAFKLATEAAVTVMRVDQIIMAKQAGGPKPKSGPGDDD